MTLSADHKCGKSIHLEFINKQLCDSELGAIVRLEDLSNIIISHDSFELGLEVSECDLVIRVLKVEPEFTTLTYKNKLTISYYGDVTILCKNEIMVGGIGTSDIYTFKSQKQLLKLLRRLTQCK